MRNAWWFGCAIGETEVMGSRPTSKEKSPNSLSQTDRIHSLKVT